MARHGENIYKRKDGRYEGRYVTGRKSNGATQFGYIFGRQYAEVRDRLIEKKAAALAQARQRSAPRKQTVAQWMTGWMENEVLGSVKASSYQTYQNQLNRHLLPGLGSVELSALTPWAVHLFLEGLREKGLSESTVRGAYRLLAAGMRSALEEGFLLKNPCKRIRAPRGERREPRVLNREEQRAVEAALSAGSGLAGLTGMYTGMRLGEICGLKWSDIDWEQGVVTVRRTVQRLKRAGGAGKGKTYLAIGTPKSYRSHRTIPLPAFLLERLKEQWQAEGQSGAEEGFVFSAAARPAEPRTVQRRFQSLIRALGFTGVHFHTLRHSYGTRLLELGVDVKTVSVLLGHDSAKTTLDCYAHSLMERRREAVGRLSALACAR